MTPEQLRRLEEVEAFNTGIASYVAVIADMAEKGKDFNVGIAQYVGALADKQVEAFDQLMAALDAHIRIHNQSSGPLDRESEAFLKGMVAPLAEVSRIGKRVAAIARLRDETEEN